MYQCVERRSKYFNLYDIRGTGLASAFIYQPIGSKYIRVPDLDNALDSLRAEYDKLKGELALGNDNPSIVAQLKVLVVNMFAYRLISMKSLDPDIDSIYNGSNPGQVRTWSRDQSVTMNHEEA
jgi:hypothetical protein